MQDKADTATSGFQQGGAREQLVAWLLEHVLEWERWRKEHKDPHWAVFLRKWRGVWSEDDRTRGSERSRLISPALQQAVEEGMAEIEEAVVGDKDAWFDVDDNLSDGDVENWQQIRKQAIDDMDYANVQGAIVECCGLMGAVYGTAIGKLVTDVHENVKLKSMLDVKKSQIVEGLQQEDRVVVSLEPIRPDQFVIDTSVNKPGREGIAQALGMAHRLPRPKHGIRARMASGHYWEVPLDGAAAQSQGLLTEFGDLEVSDTEDATLLTEYHGKVPRALLEAAIKDGPPVDEIDTRDMVESICTFVDDAYLVAARENDNLKKDRDIIAAPYDLLPGSFWGRGVAEKGINSQKALDAQLRAQIDGLAYTVHPMLGVDARKRDPRHKVEVAPGKVLYVNGDPREALMPLNFGRIDPTTFTSTGILERLIQTATGTGMAAAMQAKSSASNPALGVSSMVQGGLTKRTKRTLRLMERHFLLPLIEKFILRHMQYNEEIYSFVDLRFRVRTATSLMAREVENQNLVQLLQTVPPVSPAFYALLGQIVQNSSMKDKEEVLGVIQMVIQGQLPGSPEDQKNQPDPIEEQRKVADLEEVVARTGMKKAATAKTILEVAQMGKEPDGAAEAK